MMRYRLITEATGNPQTARFLHVLHASDAAPTDAITYISETRDGIPYEGITIGNVTVLFAVDMGSPALIQLP